MHVRLALGTRSGSERPRPLGQYNEDAAESFPPVPAKPQSHTAPLTFLRYLARQAIFDELGRGANSGPGQNNGRGEENGCSCPNGTSNCKSQCGHGSASSRPTFPPFTPFPPPSNGKPTTYPPTPTSPGNSGGNNGGGPGPNPSSTRTDENSGPPTDSGDGEDDNSELNSPLSTTTQSSPNSLLGTAVGGPSVTGSINPESEVSTTSVSRTSPEFNSYDPIVQPLPSGGTGGNPGHRGDGGLDGSTQPDGGSKKASVLVPAIVCSVIVALVLLTALWCVMRRIRRRRRWQQPGDSPAGAPLRLETGDDKRTSSSTTSESDASNESTYGQEAMWQRPASSFLSPFSPLTLPSILGRESPSELSHSRGSGRRSWETIDTGAALSAAGAHLPFIHSRSGSGSSAASTSSSRKQNSSSRAPPHALHLNTVGPPPSPSSEPAPVTTKFLLRVQEPTPVSERGTPRPYSQDDHKIEQRRSSSLSGSLSVTDDGPSSRLPPQAYLTSSLAPAPILPVPLPPPSAALPLPPTQSSLRSRSHSRSRSRSTGSSIASPAFAFLRRSNRTPTIVSLDDRPDSVAYSFSIGGGPSDAGSIWTGPPGRVSVASERSSRKGNATGSSGSVRSGGSGAGSKSTRSSGSTSGSRGRRRAKPSVLSGMSRASGASTAFSV